MSSAPRFSISRLYTGSAADYDKPSLHAVGTGEGAQAYGWGLYASTRRDIAEHYAKQAMSYSQKYAVRRNGILLTYDSAKTDDDLVSLAVNLEAMNHASAGMVIRGLKAHYIDEKAKEYIEYFKEHINEYEFSKRPPKVHSVYEQTFFTDRPEADESHLLDWFGHPNETIKEILAEELGEETVEDMDGLLGSEIYETFVDIYGSPKAASEQLAAIGIDGVKYPAQAFHNTKNQDGRKGWNYVSFRDDNIRVDHKWTDGQPRFSITVRHAMNDLADGKDYGVLENEKYGKIRFPLGRYGKRGFGLLHIIEQRMAKDGATLDEAVDTAFNVAIAATIGKETESRKNTRHLDYNGTRAIIGIMPDNTIVITGYEIDTDDSVVAKQRATKVAPQPYVRSAEVIRALKRKLFSTTSIPYSGAGAQGENVADGVRAIRYNKGHRSKNGELSKGGAFVIYKDTQKEYHMEHVQND